MTDTITTNAYTGVVLTDPAYGNPVTVASGVTVSGDTGVSAASSWTVQNYGSVAGTAGSGVDLAAGAVTNAADANISGTTFGVTIAGAGTVDNSGTITGSRTDYTPPVLGLVYVPPFYIPHFGEHPGGYYPGTITGAYTTITGTAVGLGGGGAVSNAEAADIAGGRFGVKIAGGAGTIDNYGTISANGFYYHYGAPVGSFGIGAYLIAGGTVTNHDGGTITGFGSGVKAVILAATVINAGSIGTTGTLGERSGVYLDAGGSVTNLATGTISAATEGIVINGDDGTVVNQGHIAGQIGVALNTSTSALLDNSGTITGIGAGVIMYDGGSVINETTGSIGGGTDGVYFSQGGSLTNAQSAGISGGAAGVKVEAAAGTIDNSGTITGTTGMGVDLEAGGSVTNAATGTIAGVTYGVKIAGGAGSVDNLGTITGSHTISTAGGTYRSHDGYQIGGPAYDTTITSGSSTVTGTAVELDAGGTVTNAGGNISGATYGVKIAGGVGTVSNSGTITGYSTTYRSAVTLISVSGFDMTGHATYSTVVTPSYMVTTGIAVDLAGGGSVTNAAGGLIAGGEGVYGKGQHVTVENAGTITGISGVAVFMDGTVGNRLIVDAGAVFNGSVVANGSVANTLELSAAGGAGTINGIGGQYQGFQTVTIDSGAQWDIGTISDSDTVENAGTIGANSTNGLDFTAAATVNNAGSITGGYAGIFLHAGGYVTNQAGATITGGTYSIYAQNDAATIDNAGSIADGIVLRGGGSLTNEATGTISGGGDALDLSGGNGTIVNEGHINGTFDGLSLQGLTSVDNIGTITGGGFGIYLGDGGTITNHDGGLISGTDGVYLLNGGTVVNAGHGTGTITGVSFGAYFDQGGSLTNGVSGTISGNNAIAAKGTLDVANSGTILSTGQSGVNFESGGGTLTNASTGTIGGGAYGVLAGSDPVTVTNSGAISGSVDGIQLEAGGKIVNAATASITGSNDGIRVDGPAAATIENAGTITGNTHSVLLNNAGDNTLIIHASAVFNGAVTAYGNDNTIELKAGGTGTLNGLGGKYSGFQTVTIDSGATWTVAGTIAGFQGETIQGFDSDDRLDLTDLTYNSHATLSVDGSDVLNIVEGGVTVASVQLFGDFSTDFFHLADDHNGGSYVTENETPACYCRGTLILTDRGQIAVEGLRIGDRLITASGTAMPLRWIGRRSYRGPAAKYNDQVQPIRFTAGSIAEGIPSRDLLVSPEHAMFLDGVLIPARHLVNGASILKTSGMDDIQYFHLELESHAVIVAEGALSESFVDDNSRGIFHNAADFRKLYPNAPRPLFAEFCAPRVEDGAVLQAVRDRIAARSTASTADRQPWALAS